MKKYCQYLKYIFKHKYFVYLAAKKINLPLLRALFHDLSKFYPSEIIAYTEYFYGKCDHCKLKLNKCLVYKESTIENFEIAWNYHQKRNKHHWQYWILFEDEGNIKVIEMPKKYVLEMIADWMGAGRAITGKWEVGEWYEKNKYKMNLHSETRKLVEQILISRT